MINTALGLREDAYRFAYWLTGNKHDAEDVLHNAYLNVLQRSEEIDLSRNFKSWFLTSILNSSRHTQRKIRKNYLSLDEKTIQSNRQTPLETLVSDEDEKNRDDIILFIYEEASEEVKKVISLRLRGFTYVEIASALDLPLTTIESRILNLKDKYRPRAA